MILSLRFTDCTVCLTSGTNIFFLFNICHSICQLFVNVAKSPGETHFFQLFSTKSFSDLTKFLRNLENLLLLLLFCHVNIVPQNCSNAHKRYNMHFFLLVFQKGGKGGKVTHEWLKNTTINQHPDKQIGILMLKIFKIHTMYDQISLASFTV